MAFRSYYEGHSIVEVVFQIILERPVARDELQAIQSRHSEWLDELPASRLQDFPLQPVQDISGGVHLVVPPQPGPQNLTALEFASYRRDGSFDWRFSCMGQLITVNCLTYTRWDRVWARARKYLDAATATFGATGNRAIHLGLQYIDVFVWEGNQQAYKADLLLNRDSPYVSKPVLDNGPLWHLHQGWFSDPTRHSASSLDAPSLPVGRLLERLHIDSTNGAVPPSQATELLVRMDSVHRYDFAERQQLADLFSAEGVGLGCFELMHAKNKQMMAAFLTSETARRINLHA